MISRISYMRLNSLRPLPGRGLPGAPKNSGALSCSLVSLMVNPALHVTSCHEVTRCDVTWRYMTWHDVTWRDMKWHDMTWRDVTWRDMTWHTTRVSACPLPVHHLVTAPVCTSSVVRICEWGWSWKTGFVHTKVSQVIIRITGSTVIPSAMWKERWHFIWINSFKQKPCSCGSPSSSQGNRLRSQDQSTWLCPA